MKQNQNKVTRKIDAVAIQLDKAVNQIQMTQMVISPSDKKNMNQSW